MKLLNKIISFIGEGVFLPKKGMYVAHYMRILDKNPRLNFQMDFFRDQHTDLQIFRKGLLKNREGYTPPIERPFDYLLELVFTLSDERSKKAFKLFKKSHLYDNAELSYTSDDKNHMRYMFFVEEDNMKLFNHIKYIIEEIYCYDETVTYALKFHKYKKPLF